MKIEIKAIISTSEKSEICDRILRSLPNWFGIESAIVDYVNDVKNMDTWVATVNDEIAGFISINKHNSSSAEVQVMGVLEKYHGMKIGTQLLQVAEKDLKNKNFRYLQVKTLSEKHPDIYYAKTRKFYLKNGFVPVEEFKTLWGEHNPCLLMIKSLESEKNETNSQYQYAVIFSSKRNIQPNDGYEEMAEQMLTLVKKQKGFLGVESVRGTDGFGLTISYWESQEDIRAWKKNDDHKRAQDLGRQKFYELYDVKICKIERGYKLRQLETLQDE